MILAVDIARRRWFLRGVTLVLIAGLWHIPPKRACPSSDAVGHGDIFIHGCSFGKCYAAITHGNGLDCPRAQPDSYL